MKSLLKKVGVFPLGDQMPMGVWGVLISDMPHVKSDGFNLIHSYEGPPTSLTYMKAAGKAGLAVMAQIGGGTLARPLIATPEEIQSLAVFDNLAWWYLQPEEIRWNMPQEMNVLVDTSELVAAHDVQHRPIYNYQPANRLPFEVAEFSPYAGLYGMGLYANNYLMPRSWVRWVMENTVEGIAMSDANSFPIAVPGMFGPEPQGEPPQFGPNLTGAEARHDAYLALASGAKGIVIFSYAHRYDPKVGADVYPAWKQVADEMNGTGQLGPVIMKGKVFVGYAFSVISGPHTSGTFHPDGHPELAVEFPSLAVRAIAYRNDFYLIAVNSAAAGITVTFTDLPQPSNPPDTLEVLFEGRSIDQHAGAFTDSFDPIGVHVYRACNARLKRDDDDNVQLGS